MSASTTNGSTAVLPPELQRAVEILTPFWTLGRRHFLTAAWAGALLRQNYSVETVEHVVESTAEAADDEELPARVARVQETDERLKASLPVTGWSRIAQLLKADGPETVRQLKAALGQTITVEGLAAAKQLPVEFLRSLGLHDLPDGGVGIPYHDVAGKVVAVKRRTHLVATRGSYWPKGVPLAAYGQDRLESARIAGYLVLVEGESDTWTLLFHGLPVLALPGAGTPGKTLAAEHVAGIQKVFVWQETDDGGATFVAAVRRRLGELGWSGDLRIAKVAGFKDPSALFISNPDPDIFRERFQEALDAAESLTIPVALAEDFAAIPWPAPLAPEAYHGLAGEIVRAIEPHSEADPAALLVQLLVGFGSVIGRSAHFVAEADRHYLNEYVVLIGKTAKGRKGSSWSRIRKILEDTQDEWVRGQVQTGLSSGEGLIWAVRDEVKGREKIKEKGKPIRYEEVVLDEGVQDKRLLVYESEFALVLRQIERQGNTLSVVLRQAWESGELRTLTKNSPVRATDAHISLVGHCTVEELRRYLSATEQANGFGNRFLWIGVRRSKSLPDGSTLDPATMVSMQQRLNEAVLFGSRVEVMNRDAEARAVWHAVYEELSEGKPGMAGALLARAEAHVMRLACLYALLDQSGVVQAPHLLAALALWEYVEASVRYAFGDALGDPVADEVLRALKNAPGGLTRSEINDLLGRHQGTDRILRGLAQLLEHGLARFEKETTGGRPVERWFFQSGQRAKSAKSA